LFERQVENLCYIVEISVFVTVFIIPGRDSVAAGTPQGEPGGYGGDQPGDHHAVGDHFADHGLQVLFGAYQPRPPDPVDSLFARGRSLTFVFDQIIL
jgi:hypothetical protein